MRAEHGHRIARRYVEIDQRRHARDLREADHLERRRERQLRDLGCYAQRALDRALVVAAHVRERGLAGRARRHVDRAAAGVVHVDVGEGTGRAVEHEVFGDAEAVHRVAQEAAVRVVGLLAEDSDRQP